MSYTIEYDRQFIKSEEGITPCWLAGDNNVTEGFGRNERRVRSWSCFHNLLGVTEEDIMNAIQPTLGGYGEHWRKSGKWVDDEALIRWVKNGCKRAATVEAILQHNPRMGSLNCYVSVWRGYGWGVHELTSYIRTTDEFDIWIRNVRSFVLNETAKGKVSCYPVVDFGTNGLDSRMVHPSATMEDPYKQVVLKGKYGYLKSIEPGKGSSWASDIHEAAVFTADEARHMMDHRDYRYLLENARMVDAKAKDCPHNAILVFKDGKFAGRYVCKRTRGRIYTSCYESSAKRYRDEASAKAAMARMQLSVQSYGTLMVKII